MNGGGAMLIYIGVLSVAYGRWVCDGCGHAMWAHNTVYRFGRGAECYCLNCARAKRHGSKTLLEMGVR